MKRLYAGLGLLALLLAVPLSAQLPRPHKSDGSPKKIFNLLDARKYLAEASFARTVVVDQSGSGDYTSVKDACDYVATQTRSADAQWTILVYPGTYEEGSFTVPDRTVVRGMQAAAAPTGVSPIITESTVSTGTWITLAGQLSDLTLRVKWDVTLSGALTAIQTSGFFASIYNTQIQLYPSSGSFALVGIAVDASQFLYFINSQILSGAATATNTVLVKTSGSGYFEARGSVFWGGAIGGGKGVWHHGTGTLYLYSSFVGGGLGGAQSFATDIVNDNGGTVWAHRTAYNTTSGAVTEGALYHMSTSTPASASAACSAGTVVWDSGFLYVCTAANTWKRAAIASW